MPTQAFEVIVSCNDENNAETAIANASSYLSYADHTDTFGLHGKVWGVEVYGGESSDEDMAVALRFDATITSDDELKSLMDSLANLSRVETVEEVA